MGVGKAIAAAGCRPDWIGAAATFHTGSIATDAHDSPQPYAPRLDAGLYVTAFVGRCGRPKSVSTLKAA